MKNNCRRKPKAIVVFLIFFSCFIGNSQVSTETSLKLILPELEEKFDVRFSYLEKDLDNIQVNLPTNLKQLDDVLNFLRDQTSLSFILLNDRYIAIRKTRTEEIFCFILKDSNTDLPISGAGVFNINGDLINFSNEAGEVVLKDSDIDKNIVIRHLGYNPVELKQEITSYRHCPEVLMIPFVEVLGESVIVNYLTTGISRRRDGSTMINTDNFGTLPGMVEPDILHILEALPGVENANETISSINIRGGTSDQNLVLYDGVKMYLTGHFFGLISAFNPGLTNKARLVKNGTSSEFGGGVSGTIDISSKNELTGKISGGAGISLVNADAYLQVPLANNLEVHLSGRRSIDNFYRSPTFSSYFSRAFQESAVFTGGDRVSGEGADFNFQDYSGKILYNFRDNHKFRLTGLIIENKLNYIENLSGPGDATERINSLAQKNLVIGGSLISNWSKNLGTTFRSYLTRYRLSALNKNTATEQSLIQSNEVLETGVKLSLKYSLSSRSVLHGGYEFSEAGVSNIEVVNNPFFSSRIKNVLRSHSVFTEMTVEQEQFFIRGGLRLNYLDRLEKFLLEPRVNINYKLSQSLNFTVQGEQKSQTLSQIIDLQEDFLGVENRRWILANGREFPVVRSNQVSTGVDFKSAGWFVDLETYYKKVEGINTSTQGFRDQHEFRRTKGSYDSKGVELLINKKFNDLQVYLNYTLAESSYEFPALEPPYFPNNLDIRHSFSLAMNYSFKNLIFSLGGKAAGGKPFTAPVEDRETRQEGNLWFVNYDSPNAVNLPFYFRLDASASYNFKISEKLKGEFNAGVVNLTNRKNIINRYYRVDAENSATAIQVDEKSLGFTPNILFRIIF